MAHTHSHQSHRLSPRRALRAAGVAALCAVMAGLLASPAAQANPDRTGVYSGKAEHGLFSFAPDAEPYETTVVVRVNDRRVTGIHVDVRLECPEVSILDLRFSKLVLKRKPRLTGADNFVLQANGITIRGHVGARKAEGTIDAAKDGCRSPGATWVARKRRTL